MATFLWDASHFDGQITLATMQRARTEGIAGFTHKLGEGATHGDDDSTAAGALTAARDAGIPVLGGYWFCHGDSDAVAQADLCIAVADAKVPWWREFAGWFWQPDCENESGHPKPMMTWIKTFSDRLATKTGRRVIVYASHGQYGDGLGGLGHPLWNANYPSSRKGQFRDLYPGDSFSGWAKYSGQVPVICQYTSSATIAGLTTCDANAFRGSLDDLLTLIGATSMPLTPTDIAAIWAYKLPAGETARGALQDAALRAGTLANSQIPALIAAAAKTDAALEAVTTALATAGPNVNTATILAAIKAQGATESAAVTALSNQLSAFRAAIAAGDMAAATALAAK